MKDWKTCKITNYYDYYIMGNRRSFSNTDEMSSAYKKDGVWVVNNAIEAIEVLIDELETLRKSQTSILEVLAGLEELKKDTPTIVISDMQKDGYLHAMSDRPVVINNATKNIIVDGVNVTVRM